MSIFSLLRVRVIHFFPSGFIQNSALSSSSLLEYEWTTLLYPSLSFYLLKKKKKEEEEMFASLSMSSVFFFSPYYTKNKCVVTPVNTLHEHLFTLNIYTLCLHTQKKRLRTKRRYFAHGWQVPILIVICWCGCNYIIIVIFIRLWSMFYYY